MLLNIILVIAGLGVLIVGGDLLVRGSVSLAQILKVPTLLISLTIVAFGTSAPELVVTVGAVSAGNAGIAMGNIIGSNIANILLVLGLPAMIYPISFATPGLKRHGIFLALATAVFAYYVYFNKSINMQAGIVFLVMITGYIGYIWKVARTNPDGNPTIDDVDEFSEGNSKWKTPLFIIIGLIALPLGANLLVENASIIARTMNVRDELIGLTIVAFGTSLPELATVYAAALKKQADIAVGNIIGSNIFNLLFVGGAAGLIGTSTFSKAAEQIDMPLMIVATFLAILLIFRQGHINRLMGLGFTIIYLGYILFIGLNAGVL